MAVQKTFNRKLAEKRLKKTVEKRLKKGKLVVLSWIAPGFPAMLEVKSLNQKAGPERE